MLRDLSQATWFSSLSPYLVGLTCFQGSSLPWKSPVENFGPFQWDTFLLQHCKRQLARYVKYSYSAISTHCLDTFPNRNGNSRGKRICTSSYSEGWMPVRDRVAAVETACKLHGTSEALGDWNTLWEKTKSREWSSRKTKRNWATRAWKKREPFLKDVAACFKRLKSHCSGLDNKTPTLRLSRPRK